MMPRRLQREWIAQTTATTRNTYPGFALLPTAFANWLAGFLTGVGDVQHTRAIDALLLMSIKPHQSDTARLAITAVRGYLELHHIATFVPPPQKKRAPR